MAAGIPPLIDRSEVSTRGPGRNPPAIVSRSGRSEEHTSELQSLAYLVCRLLLEKKKKAKKERARISYNYPNYVSVCSSQLLPSLHVNRLISTYLGSANSGSSRTRVWGGV